MSGQQGYHQSSYYHRTEEGGGSRGDHHPPSSSSSSRDTYSRSSSSSSRREEDYSGRGTSSSQFYEREGGSSNSYSSYSTSSTSHGRSSGSGSGSRASSEELYTSASDTIYFSGLPDTLSETELAERFGSIGIIKIDKKTQRQKITIYKDKETGIPKGDGIITYDDPEAAKAAIEWFNGTELLGKTMKVEFAQRREIPGRGRGRGRGGGFGGRGGRGRGGGFGGDGGGGGGGGGEDWQCPSCSNTNWARRTSCNRCMAPKPEGASRDDWRDEKVTAREDFDKYDDDKRREQRGSGRERYDDDRRARRERPY